MRQGAVMKPTLIVMAKTPKLGLAKRRLAAEIGDGAAWRFYRICLETTLRRLSRDPRWRLVLAVTPDADCGNAVWQRLAARFGAALKPQGKGDLGKRMQQLLAEQPRRSVLIGSDIPGIRPGHIAQAFDKLARADAVFGPAQDGGFWLVGIKRPNRRRPFDNVRWSSRYALTDTLENFRGCQVAFAAELADVDTAAAHRQMRRWAERLIPPRHL